MPGLVAWNEANRTFRESGVAAQLEALGLLWQIADNGCGGHKVVISRNKAAGEPDISRLQCQTNMKLEFLNNE